MFIKIFIVVNLEHSIKMIITMTNIYPPKSEKTNSLEFETKITHIFWIA